MLVACVSLLLSAVVLVWQVRDRRAARRGESRAELHARVVALHAAIGRPTPQRLRRYGTDPDGLLDGAGSRHVRLILEGAMPATSPTGRALVRAMLAHAERQEPPPGPSLADAAEWERLWAVADAEAEPVRARHWAIGVVAAAVLAVALGLVLRLPAGGDEPIVADQLIVATDSSGYRVRAAVTNAGDVDRTVTSLALGAHSPAATHCAGDSPYVFALAGRVHLDRISSQDLEFTGEVEEPGAGSTLPARGRYAAAACSGRTELWVEFDVVVVLRARTVTTIEIRVPQRLTATLETVDGTAPEEPRTLDLALPGMTTFVATDSTGHSVAICRDGRQPRVLGSPAPPKPGSLVPCGR
jgi:hypothetical protein